MRWGGALAGVVLLALAMGGVPASAAAGPPAPTHARAGHLWALTKTKDGRLQVVRGDAVDRASHVLSIEQDAAVHSLGTSDPLRPQQWALDRVPFEVAWTATRGAGVTVAVVDTGVRGDQQDLIGSVLPGIDYIDHTDGRIDPGGHGTAVAGIIAAHVNNGLGIAGAAPAVRILPVRVLDGSGSGSSSDVAAGVIWAADHGARVINLSLGGGPSPGIQTAMQYARSRGAVVVAAGGNNYEAGNGPVYPAAYPEAIATAAVTSGLQHAYFSNTGSYIDVAAPGAGIVVPWGTGPATYAQADGTSFATPYASAAAALIVAENPALTAPQVTWILEGTATDLGAAGRDGVYGDGLVNPRAALLAAMPHPAGWNTKGHGYWTVDIDGGVHPFGGATFHGDLSHVSHTTAIVASARTPTGQGYWLAGADGGVFAFGDARFYGSMGGVRLGQPIVAMAATPTGRGYLLLGRDGGVFAFGDAPFYGSTGARRLNAPVLDLATTPDGRGYWFVAADGGVFSFGNARFYGSTGGMRLAKPVRSMGSAADGGGYWMVADDGGIFAFSVPFEGSLPVMRALGGWPYVPSVRLRALPSSDGYYILGSNGSVSSFGTAHNFGDRRGIWAVDLMLAP
jgi:subtilisin family serine protease